MTASIEIDGLDFYDARSGREMKYVYPDNPRRDLAGWLLYRHVEGHWVTLRKATAADIAAINGAVIDAHHRALDGRRRKSFEVPGE